ncbi:MAG: hypothetical protein DWQ34_27260 [Planctomycetota bacterium]|nr:MAG: hypothetical protein DWQ29_16650 [Planctomycetota bacterium]REJ86477.1 MAG: hypothetical protein DWQ34_27260 [Planctomycetota bacterium]REK28067.1 MAG: hypothetical protein DWQ41_06555 [Planctomycetota bacterium]REK37594.1 MAG: hypothetical protein DWQ45_06240 [Planctomycetota bacterium]
MPLIDEVTKLRDDCLSALDASHDYYAHTKRAWRIVQQLAQRGYKVTIRNQVTGNTINETQLPGMAQEYVTGHLASATFQHFVSLLEHFVFDLLRAWLTEYPRSLSGKEVEFRIVLDAAGKSEIIAAVVEREVLGIAYQRLAEWFEHLERIAKLGCPTADQIQRLAEIKASRDVLVHNNGVTNSRYVGKSMGQARFAEGEALELPEVYHRESWQLIRQVVTDVADAAINKLGN